MNRITAKVLSLALAVTFIPRTAYAEESEGRVRISYVAEADERFGAPGALDPSKAPKCETLTIAPGEEVALAASLETDSIIGIENGTNTTYIGEWTFSGWTIPDTVSTREIAVETGDCETEKTPQSKGIETSGRTIIWSYQDAVITGHWTFTPKQTIYGTDSIELYDASQLTMGAASLEEYRYELETKLDAIYATGLFSESIIQFMKTNSKNTPLQDRNFSSVELSEAERIDFLNVVKRTYDTLVRKDGNANTVTNGIKSIMAASPSNRAGIETAFVVYCAEKAGLLEGKSRALTKTADITELYDYLKNDACADIITAEELLQVYCGEDGETDTGFTYNDITVDLAHDDNWYDASNGKKAIQPGDLIVFKDEHGVLMTVGIIDSVEGRSITYVMCGNSEIPARYSLDESDLEILGQMGTSAEIIGLRSCDVSRIIYHFLVNEMKLPVSSALGIMGNLYYESKFSPTALGDGNTSFGICQWHNERFRNLVIFCMKNRYNVASLEGQLHFLAYELKESYPVLLSQLTQGDASINWAKEAGYRFCRGYEMPAELELNSVYRGALASGVLWNDFSKLFLTNVRLESIQISTVPAQSTAQAISEGMQTGIQQQEQTVQPLENVYGETEQPVENIQNETVTMATEQATEAPQPAPQPSAEVTQPAYEQPPETPQPATEQQVSSIIYTVQQGDTLASICAALGIDYACYKDEIRSLNNIRDENILSVGQTIIFLSWMMNGNSQG